MEHQAGDKAGAGSFRCADCGFAVTLRERDSLPQCPGCGGRRYGPAPMFNDTVEVTRVEQVGEVPAWLDATRDRLDGGAYVTFADGDEVRAVALDEGWTRIGRSLSAEVRIDDPTVSRRHALIHRDGDTVRVLDDRSLNGIFHNGKRVDLDELSDGDTITVGRFDLHYIHVVDDRALASA